MIDEEEVRRRAHEIWLREGRPEGRQEEHWRQALDELRGQEHSGIAPHPDPGNALLGGTGETPAEAASGEATPAKPARARRPRATKRTPKE